MNDAKNALLRRSATRVVPFACAALACLAPELRAQTQVVFGIDYHGATISQPASGTGTPIHESDLLRPPFGQPTFGPMPPPALQFNGSQLGLPAYSACIGQTPGSPCHIEVDAISFGNDAPFDNTLPIGAPGRARIYFSVDRFATGMPGTGISPNVFSECSIGVNDAAADVFTVIGTITGPPPPFPIPLGANTGVFDGNGLPNVVGKRYRGLGLREQGQPGPFDDLDALTIAPLPTTANPFIYYSLDGVIVDPLTLQTGSNSGALAGFSPSAILRRNPAGGAIQVYANPAQLGLLPTADDLDALLLTDNGDGIYQPSLVNYDWLTGATDMVLFSVRRGSQIVGQFSSGSPSLQIVAGDILQPPLVPGQPPRVFIAAEQLGLRAERGMDLGDELDALGSAREPYIDCNNNGRDDAEDIAVGYSGDTNGNGIPDECEKNYTRYCYCVAPSGGPCGNDSATAGCLNNTTLGGLLSGARTTSVATDDLEMAATQLPPFSIGLLFMGPTQMNIPFGDGRLCVGPTVYRLQISGADLVGNALYGPGFVAMSNGIGGAGVITAGSTFNFQVWYRDSATYCTPSTYNLTNGLSVVFSP